MESRAGRASLKGQLVMEDDIKTLYSEYPFGFSSSDDFDEFVEMLIKSSDFQRVDIKLPFSGGVGFTEYWYKRKSTNQIYRLVEPDPPFKGNWSIVVASETDRIDLR